MSQKPNKQKPYVPFLKHLLEKIFCRNQRLNEERGRCRIQSTEDPTQEGGEDCSQEDGQWKAQVETTVQNNWSRLKQIRRFWEMCLEENEV